MKLKNNDNGQYKICGINQTQRVLAGKWKISILWFLKDEARRYTEIQRFLNNLSQGSLTKQPKELEKDNVVDRKVYPEVPPKVEYSLTQKGKKLIPIVDLMEEFGNELIKEYMKKDKKKR